MNNYIQKDRYTETIYRDEKKLLSTSETGSYQLDAKIYPKCIQNGYTELELELGKDRLNNTNLSIKKETQNSSFKKSKNYALSEEFYNSLKEHPLFGRYSLTKEIIAWKIQAIEDWSSSKGKIIKDWGATCRNWLSRDIEEGKIKSKEARKEDMMSRFGFKIS
jgi:hypothetical protein